MIQVGPARGEVVIVDHHQMTPVIKGRKVVAVIRAVMGASGRKETKGTTSHPNPEAGAEVDIHRILGTKS